MIYGKISYTLISRGKNYCKETPWEKLSYTEKKNVTPLHVREKIYHQRFGKIIFTQTKSPIPPSQVKGEERGETDVLAG